MKTYLITADIFALMSQWAEKNGFVLPPEKFFHQVNCSIAEAAQNAIGDVAEVKILPADILADGVKGLISTYAENRPLVVMDRLFHHLEVPQPILQYHSTRTVEYQNGKYEKIGEMPRPNFPRLDLQANQIMRAISPQKEVVIVDDGYYEGDSLVHCARILESQGLVVKCAIMGIYNEPAKPRPLPFPVYSFLKYPHGDLFDWICERDFIPGVPECGRTIRFDADNLAHCAPYLLNFGDITKWASVKPEAAADFTKIMLQIAKKMYEEISRLTGRPVLATDIWRWPHYLGKPLPRPEKTEFVSLICEV